MARHHPIVRLAAEADKEGARFCVWKGATKLPNAYAGSEDLDLLVDRKSFGQFAIALANSGFFEITKPWFRSDLATRDYLFLASDGVVLHVHIHLTILFGNAVSRNYRFPIEDRVLSNRVWDDDFQIWTACPRDDLHLYLLRHLTRRKIGAPARLGAEYQAVRARCSETLEEDTDTFTNDIFQLLSQVSNGVLSAKEARRPLLRLMRRFKTHTNPTQVLPRALCLVGEKLAKSVWLTHTTRRISNGGVVVPLVGIDGSGKSSAIERCVLALRKKLPIVAISLGSGQSGASPLRKAILWVAGTQAKLKGHQKARTARDRSKRIRFPWYYKLWLLLCLRDKHRELRRAITAKANGKVVLSDRWLQSSILNRNDGPRTAGMEVKTWLDRCLVKLETAIYQDVELLHVDALLILDVSPENSVKRKPNELTIQTATESRARLKSLVWNSDRTVSISSDDPISIVDEAIKMEIGRAITANDRERLITE